jgi:hypothetical protein
VAGFGCQKVGRHAFDADPSDFCRLPGRRAFSSSGPISRLSQTQVRGRSFGVRQLALNLTRILIACEVPLAIAERDQQRSRAPSSWLPLNSRKSPQGMNLVAGGNAPGSTGTKRSNDPGGVELSEPPRRINATPAGSWRWRLRFRGRCPRLLNHALCRAKQTTSVNPPQHRDPYKVQSLLPLFRRELARVLSS